MVEVKTKQSLLTATVDFEGLRTELQAERRLCSSLNRRRREETQSRYMLGGHQRHKQSSALGIGVHNKTVRLLGQLLGA